MNIKKKLGVILSALTLALVGLVGATQTSQATPPLNSHDAVASPAGAGWCNTASQVAPRGSTPRFVPTVGEQGPRNCVMWQGAFGYAVSALQVGLRCNGLRVDSVDKDWGPKTTAYLRTFQQFKGIGVDGQYGPQTHNAVRIWGDKVVDSVHYTCTPDPAI
ncbi:MAG: peptidoglycan-binding protein [Propionibacteriaceae bacterium]|jgi:hypothetical protein|nr:peptidoglycan-binding protein [Propionibacteriaceae bacterium]